MTEFCHISPTAYLNEFVADRPVHLVLAHLVETDENYREFYKQQTDSVIIMDNSAFEMYKQGRPMYPSDKLIEMGTACNADYIVMSDYPGEPAEKTIEAAKQTAPELREAGFGTFFVPQSEVNEVDDLMESFLWAAESEHVDYIGLSILAIPNAFGVEKDNKLQRFLSRWRFMNYLDEVSFFELAKQNNKKLHMLGMVDGPNEIDLVSKYLKYIDSWDSSAAVWAGLNGLMFDGSPSGLIDGKFEKEVDFDFDGAVSENIMRAKANMILIDDSLHQAVRKSNASSTKLLYPSSGIDYNRNEDIIMDSVMDYIDSTYGAHYAAKNNISVLDVWDSMGISGEAYMSNITKYAMRFGRKDGVNVKDLYKIIHYTVFMINHVQQNGDCS